MLTEKLRTHISCNNFIETMTLRYDWSQLKATIGVNQTLLPWKQAVTEDLASYGELISVPFVVIVSSSFRMQQFPISPRIHSTTTTLQHVHRSITNIPDDTNQSQVLKSILPRSSNVIIRFSSEFVCLFGLWHDPAVLNSAFVGLPI